MILSDTRIAGDLKIANGKVYVSGGVDVPELAILESKTVTTNKPVVFSIGDDKPGTIKTTNTTISGGEIKLDTTTKTVTATTETQLSITTGSGALSIGGVVKTENANQSLVTVCQKRDEKTPTWNTGDKILISEDTCYIYSKTQKLSEYDLSTNQFVFLPSTSFITPTRAADGTISCAADGLKFRLITDPTFSLA